MPEHVVVCVACEKSKKRRPDSVLKCSFGKLCHDCEGGCLSMFWVSHGLCRKCLIRLYPEEAEIILQ